MLDPLDLNPQDFLPKYPVIILIHGYTGHRDYAPNSNIRPALLDNGNVYVISVDYGALVPEPCFPQSILNAPLVSKCLAQLINNLVGYRIVENDLLHIIGFSLGSQVAGQTANYVKQKLHHITGLDPAKPLFVVVDNWERLDAEDADFVDVIHTNPPERGVLKPIGHVDFYPNFRVAEQPGCEKEKDPGSCSHNRAPEFYAESINSNLGFWGIRCDNWLPHVFGRCTARQSQALMGYHVSPIMSGTYFLETASKPPYALGHNGAVITPSTTHLFYRTSAEHIDQLEAKLERKFLTKQVKNMQKSKRS
ncbi:lipase member H-A-like isoform X2 [Drosophila innubila]|nr:lipase member H-A-like isoform X2 [Drosophila innubila]